MYNDMSSHMISNAYMKFEMSVNEQVMMSSDQRSLLCHPTNLSLLLLIIQIFQEHQLNSRIFPVFPGVVDTLYNILRCKIVTTPVANSRHLGSTNRLTSTAFYQAFTGQITSSICPNWCRGDDTAQHLLRSCPKQEAKSQRHFTQTSRMCS